MPILAWATLDITGLTKQNSLDYVGRWVATLALELGSTRFVIRGPTIRHHPEIEIERILFINFEFVKFESSRIWK